MFGDGLPGGFNRDVLEALPKDSVGRIALIDEIKSRAKGCLAVSN